MPTVNNNFAVLQTWSKHTGEGWDRGQVRQMYDKYEWRDYYRDNIDGDGRSRYQLWIQERYTGQKFDPASMQADRQELINAALAVEARAAARLERAKNPPW